MEIIISETKKENGVKAAQKGAEIIKKAIAEKGEANIIVATGASQFELLEQLVTEDIDWKKVTAFHLDEYIGIDENHPASFRKYLKERFVSLVPLKEFHYVDGNGAEEECKRLGEIIGRCEIDVAFVGIGENGHLAFNDPPADFDTEAPYIVVDLDEGCRRQQLGEGWFPTFDDVPKQAISMSVRQILKTKHLICSVPDKRKSVAVKNALTGPVTPMVPASVLQQHGATWMFLDKAAASLL